MKHKVTIASCQLPDVHEDVEQSLGHIINYANEADSHSAKLVCYPECYLQGYVVDGRTRELALDLSSTAFQGILDKLAEVCPVLIIGLIEIESDKIFNTAVVVKDGKLIGKYRKTNLYGNEKEVFEPGCEYPVFETDGLKYGINICYDLNFPECTAAIANQSVDLLVCPCNNMMPRKNADKWKYKHNEIRAKRSVEAGVWLISSDVTGEMGDCISYGPTAIINQKGIVAKQVPLMEQGLLIYDIKTNI